MYFYAYITAAYAFVCIIMHTPPNASSNTVNNTVIFIGIPAFLIIARPFDISNKYDINKPAVLLL